MTDYGRILLAGAGSAVLLIGALISQYIGGLAPCPMCIWQRWPHLAAVILALIAVTIGWRFRRAFSGLGGLAALATAGIGLFHAGVEQRWWSGPGTCSAPDHGRLSTEELLAAIETAPLVRCDEIVWQFGLTLAGWNAVMSLGLAALWAWTAYLPSMPQASSSASQ
ncbi:MAG: disulfide bond formation protein B [Pseudomonadota bacterium]